MGTKSVSYGWLKQAFHKLKEIHILIWNPKTSPPSQNKNKKEEGRGCGWDQKGTWRNWDKDKKNWVDSEVFDLIAIRGKLS